MNKRRWGLPLRVLKAAWKECVFRWRLKELSVLDERIESGREFQTVGAAARKEREPKVRLVRGTSKRLEAKDDPRTRDGRQGVRRQERYGGTSLYVALKVREAGLNLISV